MQCKPGMPWAATVVQCNLTIPGMRECKPDPQLSHRALLEFYVALTKISDFKKVFAFVLVKFHGLLLTCSSTSSMSKFTSCFSPTWCHLQTY